MSRLLSNWGNTWLCCVISFLCVFFFSSLFGYRIFELHSFKIIIQLCSLYWKKLALKTEKNFSVKIKIWRYQSVLYFCLSWWLKPSALVFNIILNGFKNLWLLHLFYRNMWLFKDVVRKSLIHSNFKVLYSNYCVEKALKSWRFTLLLVTQNVLLKVLSVLNVRACLVTLRFQALTNVHNLSIP